VLGFLCEQLQRAMAADDPDLAGELLVRVRVRVRVRVKVS